MLHVRSRLRDVPGRTAPDEHILLHPRLRVLLVDDHEYVRIGTREVLETSDEILVVGEAADGQSALANTEDLDPDVVLVDIRLPDQNGLGLVHRLTAARPSVRVVILSAYSDPALVRAAFGVGATGYLVKTMPRKGLISAVLAAGRGTVVLDAMLPVPLVGDEQHQ